MTDVKKKSGSKVAHGNTDISTRGKGRDLDFWKARLVKRSGVANGDGKEAKDWSVRIQHAGKRQFFNLETPNKTAAAAQAKKRFEFVKAHGWEAAIQHFKYGEEKAKIKAEKSALTVGEYIAKVEELATTQSARTIHDYGRCLRTILSESLKSEGTKATREKVDAFHLDKITPDLLNGWKNRRLQKVLGNNLEEEPAKITANAVLRQAKALFGRKILTLFNEEFRRKLPEPLPFVGSLLFEEDTSSKFEPEIDPVKLVSAAVTELDAPQGANEKRAEYESRRQCYLAFLLVFASGLRRSEADMLEWDSIDFEAGTIRVKKTEYFKPKTTASARPVSLDPESVEILRGFRAQYPNDRFLLRSNRAPKPPVRSFRPRSSNRLPYAYYRAEPTWKKLLKWIVTDQGIVDRKPIHYCRKAITSYVAGEHGLYAAMRHARHTKPDITARYYSEAKLLPPGIGGFFKADQGDGEKIVEGEFTAEKPSRKKGATR
jgi:integrase